MDGPKFKKPQFVEVAPDHVVSTRGIMSIRQNETGDISIRYISGHTETVSTMSMPELLDKLGRNPLRKGSADNA